MHFIVWYFIGSRSTVNVKSYCSRIVFYLAVSNIFYKWYDGFKIFKVPSKQEKICVKKTI